jgi:hypothetical protein
MRRLAGIVLAAAGVFPATGFAADAGRAAFPPALSAYPAVPGQSLWAVLQSRIVQEPFDLAATIIFALAIVHTFLAPFFLKLSHRFQEEHRRRLVAAGKPLERETSFKAGVFHFLGEVEAIFGLWVIPLVIAWTLAKGWAGVREYLVGGVSFTEPLFVVVIMAISASRPMLRVAEAAMSALARLGGGSTAAWWLAIMTIGPLLGSLITEPAAMTISALLLGRRFFVLRPAPRLAYATLGLLFVNVSVGGTLTHFAAPPILMVSAKWGWSTPHMLAAFGWRAALGIALSSTAYLLWFRREFKSLPAAAPSGDDSGRGGTIPVWITLITLGFLAWTVLNSHYTVLLMGRFLLYLAFVETTGRHQFHVRLRQPLLVGLFLAGLVVHGGLQGWWIEPVLRSLGRMPLFWGATVLTAFNDNAAITYLASQTPDFSESLKYAVVAGAVTGGGLTVIANAPNPAGQSILSKYFPNGISATGLFLAALAPTLILALCFILFTR